MEWEDPYGGGCSTSGYCPGTSSSTYTPTPAGGAESPDDNIDAILSGTGNNNSNETPPAPQSPYSDWYSGQYSGCFMCHSAVANGQTILTNSQLANSYNNATTAQGYGSLVIIASIPTGYLVGYYWLAATGGTVACSGNPTCSATIDDMFEGASTIADDAFVAIHPASANASIAANGLNPGAVQSQYVYVTQMQYFRGLNLVTAAENAGVDPTKWISQPVTLWEVANTAGNMQGLQPIYGAFGNAAQWVSSSPLYPLIQHSQIP